MSNTTDRRNFLKGVAAGSVTGGMALMAVSPAAAQSPSATSSMGSASGELMTSDNSGRRGLGRFLGRSAQSISAPG